MSLWKRVKTVLQDRFYCFRPHYRLLLEEGELYVVHNKLAEAKVSLLRSIQKNDELFQKPGVFGDIPRLQLAHALLAYVFVLEKNYGEAKSRLNFCEGAHDDAAKTQYYASKALYFLRQYEDADLFERNLTQAKYYVLSIKDKSESQRLEKLVSRMSALLPNQKLADS